MNFQPLAGKQIVITRAADQAGSFINGLQALGAETIPFPTIEIGPVADKSRLFAAIREIMVYDWVVFTSANAVKFFIAAFLETSLDIRLLQEIDIATVGPITASALERYGIVPQLVSEVNRGESLFDALLEEEGDLTGKRFLLPRGNLALPDLPARLEAAGAEVDCITAYHTLLHSKSKPVDELIERLSQQQIDVITFASPSAAVHFKRLIEPALELNPQLLENAVLAAIGPSTRQTVEGELGRCEIYAQEHTSAGLVEAIAAYYIESPR